MLLGDLHTLGLSVSDAVHVEREPSVTLDAVQGTLVLPLTGDAVQTGKLGVIMLDGDAVRGGELEVSVMPLGDTSETSERGSVTSLGDTVQGEELDVSAVETELGASVTLLGSIVLGVSDISFVSTRLTALTGLGDAAEGKVSVTDSEEGILGASTWVHGGLILGGEVCVSAVLHGGSVHGEGTLSGVV